MRVRKRDFVWIGLIVLLEIFGAYIGLKVVQDEIRVVLSESMRPTLQMGDLIIYERVSPEEVEIGDILVFKDPAKRKNVLITHRVVNQTKEGFQTKGDACEEPDQFIVKPEDVVGKMVFRIPYLGYLFGFRYLKEPERTLVFLSLVIVPAILLISSEIRNLLTDLLSSRKKRERKN